MAMRPTQGNPPSEGTENNSEFEIAVPPNLTLPTETLIAAPCFVNQWQAATAYEHGALVRPSGADEGIYPVYQCVIAGESGEDEPEWISRVIDGELTWRLSRHMAYYQVTGTNLVESNQVETILRVKMNS